MPTKAHLVKAMVFPVVMYGCENWTIKKAEHRRIDAFELWCWRRLLRVPWTARRSNQSILKEISPEYSLEGLMLKLKLQYFGHLMRRADSFEKTLMLGKIEGRRRDNRGWDDWMASLTQWTWVWVALGVGDGMKKASSISQLLPFWGVEFCIRAQILFCVSLGGGRSSPLQGYTTVSWPLLPCLLIPSLAWLETVWTFPLGLKEGQEGWSLFSMDKKQGTQQSFHAWEPHRVLLSFKSPQDAVQRPQTKTHPTIQRKRPIYFS